MEIRDLYETSGSMYEILTNDKQHQSEHEVLHKKILYHHQPT